MNFWASLESLPGLSALTPAWQKYLGDYYLAFKALCLAAEPEFAKAVSCPRRCGCHHAVILRHDRTGATGGCMCTPPTCPDIPLTIEQITPWIVDWPRLAYGLCHALDCKLRLADLGPPETKQLGAWSNQAVPVILTIQHEYDMFASAVAQLALEIKSPFILLSPTSLFLDATALRFLNHADAAFFDLESTVTFDSTGHLRALKPPNQLFAPLLPPNLQPATSNLQPVNRPRYALRKHLGVWHLIFDGHEAFIRHERGLFYVHWLLYHPDECPIHAIDLMSKIPEIYRQQLGLPTLADPVTGKTVTLQSGARLQERSLALDDRQSMRALYKKQKELEALLDSDSTSEPEKAEALRELEQIIDFQKQHARRSRDAAARTTDAVRTAIRRLQIHLSKTAETTGEPHSPLEAFASHLAQHILAPSGQSSARAAALTYNRLPTINWTP